MKRVLVFSLAYFPRIGGAEVAVKEITDRIPDLEFHMVTLRFGVDDALVEKVGNVFVYRIGSGSYLSKIFFVPRAALAGVRLHRAHHFDGMWAVMSYMLFPVVLMRFLGVRLPYVLTLQEGDTYEHMYRRLRVLPFLPLINYGFRNATVVQAISTFLGEWARRRGFKGSLQIIPNGVDVKKFTGSPVSHNGVVLITASRLVRKNAIDDVIRALPFLPQEIRFVVLGTGPDAEVLKNLAQKLGVSHRVEWKGFVDHAALPQHLHAADIFIRPSRSEGMGNSFIEAMAAGVPVIATQEGGLADFIFDEKTAFVVEKDSPHQILQKVEEILGNPELVKKVVNNACTLALEKYDWGLVARAMREQVFARLFAV